MKKILLIGFLIAAFQGLAQQTINDTIMHDGLARDFILYVPASYDPATPVPMVFNFHGYGSNAGQQLFYGDFRSIADTAGFIIVHPNGTLDNTSTTHWNSGWGTGVDDVGFTSAMIDSISAEYSIDPTRVFSTGMSNGGFMSYHLACELSDRIAAIASVTGTMTILGPSTCNANRPIPVMEIHGTADATVPYNGNATMTAIPVVLQHWLTHNGCSPDPVVTPVPDTDMTDGCTADHLVYPGGDNGVEVEHYRIIDGGHTWPDAILDIGVTNHDFNASEKIWQFFAKYDINGVIEESTGLQDNISKQLSVYPNPSTGIFQIDLGNIDGIANVEVLSISGRSITQNVFTSSNSVRLDLSKAKNGLYVAIVRTDDGVYQLKLTKQ